MERPEILEEQIAGQDFCALPIAAVTSYQEHSSLKRHRFTI